MENSKLYHHLKKWLEKAIIDYAMIAPGDRVLVGVSGGADSLTLWKLLNSPMIFVPPFEVLAVYIDLGFDRTLETHRTLTDYFGRGQAAYHLEKTEIGSLAHSNYNRKNPCFLCSRLRRKRLFELADQYGCNRIALAHHQDDVIETLLLNIFYAREMGTMNPVQPVFGGKMTIIRPLFYLREQLLKSYAHKTGLPVTAAGCPTAPVSRRAYIKTLLNSLEKDNRLVRRNIFRAIGRVKQDYLPEIKSL
jgi:tRNA 2-thiocytidine biosynthesis protein TtcA